MENKLLIVFSHPLFEASHVHKALLSKMPDSKHIRFIDLYEKYPFFNIDVKTEQKNLLDADIVIFQYPIMWYSMPPILKQYIDLVFEHGWAYGTEGNKLEGKFFMEVISTGGSKDSYTATGVHQNDLLDYLKGSKQTALYCKMNYIPPFVVFGSNKLNESDLNEYANELNLILNKLLITDLNKINFTLYEYINNWK
ncbi:MAG: NAD(P)H-dependent oxidoreductase [Bacteroidia bacterium]